MTGVAHFEVFPSKTHDGHHHWRLVAANGEIVAQSEAYESESGAERGVADCVAVVDETRGVAAAARSNLFPTAGINVSKVDE